MTAPMLFTSRLILRLPEPRDFEGYARFVADPAAMRFLGGVQTRSEAWRSLCTVAGAWTIRGFSMFSLVERETGLWVGRAGPWQPEGWPGCEIAYGLLPAFQGRGYATEAVTAAIDYAVDVLGWRDVMHTIHPDNAGSIAVAMRLGAANRGPTALPPPLQETRVDDWGQSAASWRKRRHAASVSSAG